MTVMPEADRKARSRSVMRWSYGVATARRRIPRCRSAISSAPLDVTAAGVPDASIEATRACSPATPPTNEPDVQA